MLTTQYLKPTFEFLKLDMSILLKFYIEQPSDYCQCCEYAKNTKITMANGKYCSEAKSINSGFSMSQLAQS